jgi:hypothetical protein
MSDPRPIKGCSTTACDLRGRCYRSVAAHKPGAEIRAFEPQSAADCDSYVPMRMTGGMRRAS